MARRKAPPNPQMQLTGRMARGPVRAAPGSLNLWASHEIVWESPVRLVAGGFLAKFCPVVLEEVAAGVAFRAPPYTLKYLEVLSPVELRPRLGGLEDGKMISVRLLSGDVLKSAA